MRRSRFCAAPPPPRAAATQLRSFVKAVRNNVKEGAARIAANTTNATATAGKSADEPPDTGDLFVSDIPPDLAEAWHDCEEEDSDGSEQAPVKTAEYRRLKSGAEQLSKDFERVVKQKQSLQAELATERARSDEFAKQIAELLEVNEEKMRIQERLSCVETSELRSQVEALLLIKRQLFQRTQDLEAERNVLRTEAQAAMSDRACVVCLDRTACTVLLKCRHLVCCESCALRLRECPVCRQKVHSRMTVFTP